MKKITLLLFGFLITQGLVVGQKNPTVINESYNKHVFNNFVSKIEDKYKVKFFYLDIWTDSIIIKQSQTPATIREILKQTFENEKLHFVFDNHNNIIITNDYKINTELPSSFKSAGHLEDNANELDFTDITYLSLPEETKTNHISGSINIGNPIQRYKGREAVISGYVKDVNTGEPIIGVAVYVENLKIGTVTDVYGYYVITLKKGKHQFKFSSVGWKDRKHEVLLNASGKLDINLEEKIIQLRDVTITGDKEHNVRGLQLGLEKIDMKNIKQIPNAMGEIDLLKIALMLPGVQSVGESASGFNVRGGSTDQNLILLDNSPLFNTSHLFGFFSVFNPDVVKDFKLYKSGIPARYGGRISSVFDVSVKNGNKKKFAGSGGISPITGRLTFEGPIVKDKASFIVSGRSTYSDWILKLFEDPAIRNSKGYFYDLNAKLNIDINDKNSLITSAYFSEDFFNLNSDTSYSYNNLNASLVWKHAFTKKLHLNLKGIYSNYEYNIHSSRIGLTAFDMDYSIDYKEVKLDFSFFPTVKHTVNFGANAIYYTLNPSSITPAHPNSIISLNILDPEYGVESALYVSDEINVSKRLLVSLGLRWSTFFALGPDKVYRYNPDAPRAIQNRLDSTIYNNGSVVKTYGGPEVRLAGRYKLAYESSVKFSYDHMRQYLHMLSNTTAISPTDMWKLSDSYIPPQIGDQISLGYYKNFRHNTIETSVEIYYKQIKDLIEYKDGTQFLLNKDIETDLINGVGRAYGIELMVKKKYGRLNGWISYTYSSTKVKVDGRFLEEKINNGEFYPANYDKPHDLTLVSNYKYSRRFSVSSIFTYSTGRPVTFPVAKYEFRGRTLLHYTNRNEYRIPDYIRWDISINIDGNLKSKKLAHSSWSFSVYNLLGRKNAYSVYFVSDERGGVDGYKLSIFARPIMTVAYNFKF